jgi:tetratricopeptide (TPR) repeat protein
VSSIGIILGLLFVAPSLQVPDPDPSEYFQRAEAMESLATRSDGAARWRWLGEAARLYSKDYRGDAQGPIAAEAAFRHGQVLSRLGRDGEARGAYLRATELANEPRLLARARLELAHAARRSGDRIAALDLYLEVVFDPRTPVDLLGDAWEWRGKIHHELGQSLPAEVSFRAWQACAQTLAEEIRAWDRLACLYLELDRPERAKAALAELLAACSEALDPGTDSGRSLFRRLDTMEAQIRLRELAWQTQFASNHDGDGQTVSVAQRKTHFADSSLLRQLGGTPMQQQFRRSRAVRDNFKVLEADATGPAGAEDLHAGLLGGHARSEVHTGRFPTGTFSLFGWCEHPVAQRLAAALKACFEPAYVYQVNSDSGHAFWQGNGHRGGA